jgi:hypothetical protein
MIQQLMPQIYPVFFEKNALMSYFPALQNVGHLGRGHYKLPMFRLSYFAGSPDHRVPVCGVREDQVHRVSPDPGDNTIKLLLNWQSGQIS